MHGLAIFLGCFSLAIVLGRTGLLGLPAIILALTAFTILYLVVAQSRDSLHDFYRDLSSGERLGLGFLGFCTFFLPSFLMGRWAPLSGMALLFLPVTLSMVGPAGYARFYMLTGISIALAVARIQPSISIPILGAFLILLTACMVLEAWHHGLKERVRLAPGAKKPSIQRGMILYLLGYRLGRALLFTAPVAVLFSLLPLDHPALRPKPDRPLPRLAQSLDMDLSLLQFLLQSVVIMVGAICLALLYRWLENRRPKAAMEIQPVGMASLDDVEFIAPPRQSPAPRQKARTTNRDSILDCFLRLSKQLQKFSKQRQPEQTPHQWWVSPGGEGRDQIQSPWLSTPLEELALEIAKRSNRARYSPANPSSDEVREFEALCAKFLKFYRKEANRPRPDSPAQAKLSSRNSPDHDSSLTPMD
jgi:hypothetical protein